MPDLNLRNVDSALMAGLKTDAAMRKVTLRDYCLDILAARGKVTLPARPVERTDLTSCPLCGSKLKPWGPSLRCENCGRNW